MSNYRIAIMWAEQTTKLTTGFVYSDRFFEPFSNKKVRKSIVSELLKKNVVVWSDSKLGAFLFKRGDVRLTINKHQNLMSGIWTEGDNMIILPTVEAN